MNNCQLTLVVRSSGLILAFLNPSQRHRSACRQHGAPSPTRRANTARRCSRLVEPPTTFYTLRTHTWITRIHKSEAVRLGWWWAQRKRPVQRVGAQKCPPTALELPSAKCQVPLGARFTPLGSNTRFSESTWPKAMLLTAHILRMLLLPSAGSSLLYSLCGQIVIQRIKVHSLSLSDRQG